MDAKPHFQLLNSARSAELLQDDITHPRNNASGRTMFTSISYAIGTSDQHPQSKTQDRSTSTSSTATATQPPHMDEGGGVEPPANAVIANYFLKSHGGAHGVQSIASLSAVLFGLATYLTPKSNINLKVILVQRLLICALVKHLSGFLAVAQMSADSIPEIGWNRTRRRIEALALDPVAQYLFYCALLIVWMSGAVFTAGANISASANAAKGGAAASAAATAKVVADKIATATNIIKPFPWWLREDRWRPLCLTCITVPILVREVVSTAWVISDVLVLYYLSKSAESNPNPAILKAGKGAVDAAMSLLLTPKTWRSADAVQRQKLLAKLVGKVSLGFEVGTCLILILDGVRAFIEFSIEPVASRPGILSVAKRVMCARLMINFMLVRRKKVIDLVTDIRGGAIHVPGRVLDCLLEPAKALGLEEEEGEHGLQKYSVVDQKKSLAKWISILFGV